jgi:hypothetical protein
MFIAIDYSKSPVVMMYMLWLVVNMPFIVMVKVLSES